MKKKLKLIVGLHRTGTTSIQRTCLLNKEQLLASGYYYPIVVSRHIEPTMASHKPENHSRIITHMFSSWLDPKPSDHIRKKGRVSTKELIRAEVLEVLNAAQSNLIMCAERCSTLSIEQLADLREWFEKAGYSIDVYCFLRKPTSWLHSIVAQRVSGIQGPKLTIDQVIDEFVKGNTIFSQRLRNLREIFPDTSFISVDRANEAEGGTAEFILNRLGVQLDNFKKVTRLNESHSNHCVRLHSQINTVFGNRESSINADSFHRRLPKIHSDLYDLSGPKFRLTETEMKPLFSILQSENQWLEETFGEGFYDSPSERGFFQLNPLDENSRTFLLKKSQNVGPRMQKAIGLFLKEN